MRTSLTIALLLLGATIAAGMLTSSEVRRASERYVSAAEELRIMTARQEWARAADVVSAYIETWQASEPALQMLINHEDTDSVTLSLVLLQAAIRSQDMAGCSAACAELRENALHLWHRDAFTLANVL